MSNSDTPRTDALEDGIRRRKELRGFSGPEDDRDRIELCRQLERGLEAANTDILLAKLAIQQKVELLTSCEDALAAANKRADAAETKFDFAQHLKRQREWSEKTFGPGGRVAGVCDHIRKELLEVEADNGVLSEWVDVVILGLDGAWRSGASPEQIISAIVTKQTKNENRKWPDWRTVPAGKAIEHDRSQDEAMRHD